MSAPGLLPDTVPDLRADNARLRGLLQRVEWAGPENWTGDYSCPICCQSQRQGHAPGCELAGAVEEGT